jgi:hypothetical protein
VLRVAFSSIAIPIRAKLWPSWVIVEFAEVVLIQVGAAMFNANRHDVRVFVVVDFEQIVENTFSDINFKGKSVATLTTLQAIH